MTVIIEGPDGAGKSTLLRLLLAADYRFEEAPRIVSSTDGPASDHWQRTQQMMIDWDPRANMIYDRHPLISEYVYGPVIRRHVEPGFYSSSARAWRELLAMQATVIWCEPVTLDLTSTIQMAGVSENIGLIQELYRQQRFMWPGNSIVYNQDNIKEVMDFALERIKK